MSLCPRCHSPHIGTRNLASKVGGAVGAMTGAAIGSPLGPMGSIVGAVTGAALSGLAGGATLGEAVDAHVLDNHECLDCGHAFSLKAS